MKCLDLPKSNRDVVQIVKEMLVCAMLVTWLQKSQLGAIQIIRDTFLDYFRHTHPSPCAIW